MQSRTARIRFTDFRIRSQRLSRQILAFGSAIIALSFPRVARAGAQAPSETVNDSRYGLFGWLDRRSDYGKGVFPEPFLVDDSDLETNEFRVDWLHTANRNFHDNLFTGEVEKGFGLVTLEIEVPFERVSDAGKITEGTDNIDLGARCPVWQYVSRDGSVDSTFGVAVEVGIPTHSSLSKTTEIVPKIFNDLKMGNFTLQAIAGYSMLRGPGEEGGLDTLEYGCTLGYTISHKSLPLPGVQQLIPVIEISGETPVNMDESGRSSVLANLAFRANMKAIGRIQPRLGFGVVLPLNNAARDDAHWGLVTSLVFEY